VQLEVFSPAVIGCRQKSETATDTLPKAPQGREVDLEVLQRKVETTLDAGSLEALGLAYLSAGNIPLAQLALSRAVELEDGRASAHSALGYALLLQGKPMDARAEYGRALDADPTYVKAKANLAALRCRYGDTEGAKRELAGVKEAVAGTDVDPDWKACR
jgi:Flp pilus assembly protein TadD